MILPKFNYHSPKSLDEALGWLAEHQGEGVKILAGGTDLLVDMRSKVIPDGHRPRCQQHRTGPWHARHTSAETVQWLMALSRIPGLRGIWDEDDRIRIGSMTTISDLERSPIIREKLAGLWDGAAQLGSPLVRNRGTFGGNLCNARPAGDTAIPTLAHKGKLVIVSSRGERLVDHEDFVTGPGKTVMQEDEILKEIIFEMPAKPINSETPQLVGASYIKLANRKALEISVVGAAAVVHFSHKPVSGSNGDSSGIMISEARISLGAVAPKPLLVDEAGKWLAGKKFTEETIAEAAAIARQTARPITDHRGVAEYRQMMVEVLVKRALHMCGRRAFDRQTLRSA